MCARITTHHAITTTSTHYLPSPTTRPHPSDNVQTLFTSLLRLPLRPPTLITRTHILDRIRYATHKIYFNYLVTGPAYLLEPAERICFDFFILVLLGAIAYCTFLLAPLFMRLFGCLGKGVLGEQGIDVVERAAQEALVNWSGNMSFSVRRIAVVTGGRREMAVATS
ncbi:hypothetical protein BDV96DRAFT_594118 [Lophiotrema nucula]|uniref:Uncharacterized protein n=1 Tax=Lophiotrema nucula TaxID=690887 RepID=A0A6A5ZR86_9PLEO|nr:hypothetical protein BDV96DRAFT_594118 [Lophiotrema nucula]